MRAVLETLDGLSLEMAVSGNIPEYIDRPLPWTGSFTPPEVITTAAPCKRRRYQYLTTKTDKFGQNYASYREIER